MPVDEDEFETVKEILFTVARLQEGNSSAIDRLTTRMDTLTFQVERNSSAIDRLTTRMDTLTFQVERLVQESELDRQQATQDRAQVRSLVEALTQRFSSNGHS